MELRRIPKFSKTGAKQLREDEREALSSSTPPFIKIAGKWSAHKLSVFNIATSSEHGPIFEHLVVDESQDRAPYAALHKINYRE